MSRQTLESRFARMGARLKVQERVPSRFLSTFRSVGDVNFSVDVQRDGKGEFFEIRTRPGVDLKIDVVDVQPAERHLLLLVKEADIKQKFLCGHDERHWFVAAVPERSSASNVKTAMEALKPAEVQKLQARKKVKTEDRKRRKNEAYVRQGEWFFVPAPNLKVDERLTLHNEPLTRGNGSKPHIAEFCYRIRGETVYVCNRYRSGLTEANYRKVIESNKAAKTWKWQVIRRNPQVYVKGRIHHSDHKTIVLHGWHRVLMNTENQSRAMRNVAFLD